MNPPQIHDLRRLLTACLLLHAYLVDAILAGGEFSLPADSPSSRSATNLPMDLPAHYVQNVNVVDILHKEHRLTPC